jgi:hypothetical protein
MITFPSAPALDQEFTAGVLTWIWKGARWDRKWTAAPVQPVLTSLSPDRAPHGTFYGGTIRYLGSGFDPTCVAYYDGAPAPSTTYVSPTEIQAHGIDGPPMSADTVSIDCFVRNSVGDSAALPFRYYDQYAGLPYVTFINPGSVSWHNSANIEVDVTGTDFTNDAIVMMGPHPMVTHWVAQNMVRFDVIPTDYATGQDHEWTVTVDQANGVSNGFPFFFVF